METKAQWRLKYLKEQGLGLLILCLGSLSIFGCEKAKTTPPPPLPELKWESPDLPILPFNNVSKDWKQGVEKLRGELKVPVALETRLDEQDRQTWGLALEALERYRVDAKETLQVATLPRSTMEICDQELTEEVARFRWQLVAQKLLQQRRNLLWRLGRLELAARSFHRALQEMKGSFGSDRLRDADEAIFAPLDQLQRDLDRFDSPSTRPDGDWEKAALLPRMARHRPLLLLLDHARERLETWHEEVKNDERWGYTAASVEAPLKAIERWQQEHADLIQASFDLALQAQVLERVLGHPEKEASPWRACLAERSRRLALLATTYARLLQAQDDLAQASRQLRALVNALDQGHEAERRQIAQLLTEVTQKSAALMSFEAILLHEWDGLSPKFWESFKEVTSPIAHPAPLQLGGATQWRGVFFDTRDAAKLKLKRESPEPPQPLTRRKKPRPPFVSEVLDLVRSPARVAEVEQGLLAISELDAHLLAFHEAIHSACAKGDCIGVPGPTVPFSPRESTWIEQWRSLPVEERTLGHNLIVLELVRLHITRQLQRLAAFHAWFSELSTADLSWHLLDEWEQTWSLYTGRNGSFLSFIRALESLSDTVHSLPKATQRKVLSPRLEQLLVYHSLLYDLTLDYAHAVDRGGDPPIPIATLIATWDKVHTSLVKIEAVTIARDEKAAAQKAREEAKEKRR